MQARPEQANHRTTWEIKRYANQAAYESGQWDSSTIIINNILLTEGVNEMLLLLIGETATPFSNANAYIGIGDGNDAAVAGQTGLQGSNQTCKGMEATYPIVTDNAVAFKAVFGEGDGNHAWAELTVANGSTGSAKNLNRKVSDHGTKVAGQVWTIEVAIAFT